MASNEMERYGPFISAFNSTFKMLKAITNIPLRKPSNLNILFFRNDPKHSDDNCEPGDAFPETVLLSVDAARNNFNLGNTINWNDLALGTTASAKTPHRHHSRFDILSVQHFQLIEKELEGPPAVYNLEIQTLLNPLPSQSPCMTAESPQHRPDVTMLDKGGIMSDPLMSFFFIKKNVENIEYVCCQLEDHLALPARDFQPPNRLQPAILARPRGNRILLVQNALGKKGKSVY